MTDLDQLCPVPLEDECGRLVWRASLTPSLTSVQPVDRPELSPSKRYLVSIGGSAIDGAWGYQAAWFLIVGAQYGAEAMANAA